MSLVNMDCDKVSQNENIKVYIISCGGNAKVVIDICRACGYIIMGLFDDKYQGKTADDKYPIIYGCPLIGKIVDIKNYPNINIINAIGNLHVRKKISQCLPSSLQLKWINCIHPDAYISPSAKLGYGNIIYYGAMINSDAIIGNFNLINTYSIVEHECNIGNFNNLSPKSVLCGSVMIGDINMLGAASTVINNITIGDCNIIGAMACVIRDITDRKTVVGVPAKALI